MRYLIPLILFFSFLSGADSLDVTLIGRFTACSPNDIAVCGDLAYIANLTGGLQVLDISDPTGITQLGFLPFGGASANGVCAIDGYAVLACSDNSLRVVDIGNPSAPMQVGEFLSDREIASCFAMGIPFSQTGVNSILSRSIIQLHQQ